jgi:protease-4
MRVPALCSIAVAFASLAAPAQQGPTAGAEPPAQSFALDDDGTALAGNPGGLGFVSGLELDWLHDGFYAGGHGTTDALYSVAGAGPLALAIGWDWIHRTPCDPRSCLFAVPETFVRRTSFGAGLRLGGLGLGAVYRSFGGDFRGVGAWDFGLLARPTSWLSLGAAALDADRPAGLPRRWRLSLGLRPSIADSEVAVDVRWTECTNGPPRCGVDRSDLFFTVRTQLARGAHLLAQFAMIDRGNYSTSALLGLQLDLPHAGATYAPRFASPAIDAQDLWRIRVSSQRWPSLRLPVRRAALIDLGKALEREKPSPLALVFGQTVRDPLAQTVAALRRLADDPTTGAVVLRSGDLPIGLGKAQELQESIHQLQAAGRKVVFYLESAEDLEYSIASTADRVYAAPQAVLLVNGFSSTALFAGAGLEKLGVKAEFFRVGAYKNAPDLFTRSSMSGEQREVQDSLLDDIYGRYVKAVAKARHLDEGKLKDLLDKGILTTSEAMDAGLLDGLLYPDQLEEEVGKLLGAKVALEKTALEAEPLRSTRWGTPKKIAVVRVEGDILRGEGARDPFGAVQIAGSEPIARRIRRAADDPGVAAIVVRIDSPGGDGNASDLIWRELVRARKEKKKPVIASMGDVAASGGYYVAAGADEIWAEPSTITGSIGVFVGHFDAEELFGKLGLTLATVKRGKSADLFSPARDLNDTERKTLQSWVDVFYEQFLARVSESRGLSRGEVDAVARGRVWTGAQALERKLVDHLGSFQDAISAAKKWAGLEGEVEVDDEIEARIGVSDFASVGLFPGLPGGIGPRALRALHLLGEPGTVRAALPFDLEVR